MWKKDEAPGQDSSMHPEPTRRPERPVSATASTDRATIGRSIAIKGEVTGDEDLLIQGRVDGSVQLQQHSVTVGPDGEVKANISGRIVTVEGIVEGNVTASEQVVLRSSAQVEGDLAAPRVVVEDGARFRGGVDMGEVAAVERTSSSASAPAKKSSNAVKSEPEQVEVLSDKGMTVSGAAGEARA